MVRSTSRLRPFAVLTAVVAVTGSLLVTAPAAGAATALTSDMDRCLRAAAGNPGGVLVFADLRIRSPQVTPLRSQLWTRGRYSCVRHDRTLTVARAYAWWHGLPAARKPPYVILAVRGSAAQYSGWRHDMPSKRMLGTPDSGITSGSRLTGWGNKASGVSVGNLILARFGELTVNGGHWAGTSSSFRILSNATNCRRALTSPKGVYLMGDSITTRAFGSVYTALLRRGYIPCIDGQWGSRTNEYLALLKAGRIKLPKNVIIALGNNDLFQAAGFRRNAWEMLRIIGTNRNVVFPTVWRTKPGDLAPKQHNARCINNVIHDLVLHQPHWRTIEWAAVVQAHPQYLMDGIHLSTSGRAKRYDMYADALDALTR